MTEEEAEKFRQEGRLEVLDWLFHRQILNYSRVEKLYFKYFEKLGVITFIPWKNNRDELED